MNFFDYLDDLDSSVPLELQHKAIEEINRKVCREVGLLSFVIQQTANVYEWDNRAIIVCMQTDEVLERYVPRMLEWLDDINKPGAARMYDRLLVMDSPHVEDHIKDAQRWAKSDGQGRWLKVLCALEKDRKNRLGG